MNKETYKVAVAGPTYEDQTIYLNGVLSLDGSRKIREESRDPGGTGLCYGIALSRQGNETTVHSVIGTDLAAQNINRALGLERSVRAEWLTVDGPTDHAIIFIDEGNHKCVASWKKISDLWVPDSNFVRNVDQSDALVFTSFSNTTVKGALETIERDATRKPFIMWAPHHGNCEEAAVLADLLHLVDHITLSREEYEALYKAIGDPLEKGVTSMTITSGKNGCELRTRGFSAHYQPIRVIENPLDTNGAGEAFGSSFLSAFIRTGNYDTAVATGSYVGGLHVQRRASNFPQVDVNSLMVVAQSEGGLEKYRRYLVEQTYE